MFELFKQLFPDKDGQEGDDVERSALQNTHEDETIVVNPLNQSLYRTVSCQSTGKARAHNEDTVFTFESQIFGVDSPIFFGLYLVADGMGGHQSGEIASNLAAQAVSQFLLDEIFTAQLFEKETFSDQDSERLIREAVEKAQQLIQQRVPGGGTTLTIVIALGDRMFSAHVGDSRLYVIGKEGSLELKTKDHSLVKRLVDLGEITESEASIHPQRNVLYRALGQTDPFEPDFDHFRLQNQECLLICSDGLWGVVGDQKMGEIINQASSLEETASDLVRAANDLGGPDNISVVLVERLN